MAPTKKRENQFFNVGVQGRKTGITLEDRGVRDEHGMEPISGIFSSPVKSPPKRGSSRKTGGTVTTSESMDIQESTIPDITDTIHAGHLLRSARTKLPPPKSRSPMKTALGSSPRRQTSMGPRSSLHQATASPSRESSHPAVSRRLDFDQEDSSLQETPALSGSGQRRGKARGKARANIYDIERSLSRDVSAALEDSIVQGDISVNEISEMLDGFGEESFDGGVGDGYESMIGTNGVDASADLDEPEVEPEPTPQPVKRGRKRKSDAIDSTVEEPSSVSSRPRRRGAGAVQAASSQKSKVAEHPPTAKPRGKGRSKRVSEMTDQESSTALDNSVDETENTEKSITTNPGKSRGRHLTKAKPQVQNALPAKEKGEPAFKKPKAITKPGAIARSKSESKTNGKSVEPEVPNGGKLVDSAGNPLSKADIDHLSTTSTASRYGRGRTLLSVYREMGPDEATNVSMARHSGRHLVKPVDFWKSEKVTYAKDGSLESIVVNETQEPPPKKYTGRPKGKKRALRVIEEEDDDVGLEDWEERDGLFVGTFRGFNPVAEVPTSNYYDDALGWSEKGIRPVDVPEAQFKFTKLASAPNSFFSWGAIDLPVNGSKRTKNCRRMHMVFFVQTGTVTVRVHDNEFTIRKGGLWQVPRGNTYSITNVGKGVARIFFAQAHEQAPVEPDHEQEDN
ncbi:uncharacterized protein BDR25DRAFT_260740 [Lindgomyces ingoldianus]|uniref:Uncharacterized protein n=1 Tax=Lindgomyces ingoldianus TaxID=673940 RepID=A0ACB6QYL7_9PLEO|nr:uncharacterized protein BDR25DRAFT_260740 [Lindgomyces ingoldianus]KAF2471291.1 hypothetical protein BDR25DRAFT_260740 [Lindgomyces ingoldianus]